MIDRPRNMDLPREARWPKRHFSDPTPGDALKAETLARPDRDAALPRRAVSKTIVRKFGNFARRATLVKAALSVADQAIVSGTSFVTAVIVARNCSAEELGLYYLTLSIALILIGLQQNVISAPFILLCSRRKGQDLAEYTGSTWIHHLALTAATMVTLVALIAGFATAGSTPIVPGLWMLLGAGPLLLMREAIRRFAFARLELGLAIVLDTIVCVVQLGTLVTLGHYGLLSVSGAFGAMALGCGLACVGWYVFSPHAARFAPRRFLPDWSENWSFAKWALLSYFIVDTIPFIMPWIVEAASGAAVTGVLGGCATLVGMTNIIVVGTGNFLKPQAAKSYSGGGVTALGRVLAATSWLFILVFGTLCLTFLVAGDPLAVLVFGSGFDGSGMTLSALGANVLVGSLGLVAASGLWALGWPRAGVPSDVLMLLSTLVAAAYLVVPYGALGAALASLIGTSAGTVVKVAALVWAMRSERPIGGSPR